MRRITGYVLLVIIILFLCGCGGNIPTILATPIPTPPASVTMATLPDNYQEGSVVISDDGQHIAYVVSDTTGEMVVQDGQPGTAYGKIGNIYFSPVADQLYYWALKDVSGTQKIILLAAGKEIVTDYSSQGFLSFSEDGLHWSSAGSATDPSSTSGNAANTVVVLMDGSQIGRYENSSTPVFSPDGKHYAFVTSTNKQIRLVVDGKEIKTFEQPAVKCSDIFTAFQSGPDLDFQFPTTYLPSGQIFQLTLDKNGWTVYQGNQPITSYLQNVWGGGNYQVINFDEFKTQKSILASSIRIAKAADVAAWWERLQGEDDQWHVVSNGKPVDNIFCKAFDGNRPQPAISEDGKHVAYACASKVTQSSEGGQQSEDIYVVVNGEKFGPYQNTWGIGFSKDGLHSTFIANTGTGWSLFKDGKSLLSTTYDSAYGPVLSDDGGHVGWTGTQGQQIELSVDGKEVHQADELFWGPKFIHPDFATWIVREGKQVVRVSFNAPAQ